MGDYIEECIRSVLDATYKHLEVLVINDGSTDPASIEKLKSIARLENVRVFHHKNQGLAFTRNYGAEVAKGAYLAFLDADDKVAPTYYEKAVAALQRNRNVYFVGAWVKYFGNSTRLWPTFTPQPPFVLVHNPVNSSGSDTRHCTAVTTPRHTTAAFRAARDNHSSVSTRSALAKVIAIAHADTIGANPV